MKVKLAILLLFVLAATRVSAQTHLYRDTSIRVEHSGGSLLHAWAGGMNSPVFASIDMNGDLRLDLLVIETISYRITTFLNTGLSGKLAWVHAPEYQSKFPADLEGWVRTYDWDCDGDMDLFTYSSAAMKLYRNDYSPGTGLVFSLVSSQINTHYGSIEVNLYVSRVNMPALSDIDNDGDMDVLSFGLGGSWVEYHRNYSMDSTGTCDQLKFYNIPQCWGYFALSNLSNVALLPPIPSCPLLPANPFTGNNTGEDKQRHSGSSLLALDINGDGDKDLLNGDILSNNLLYLENCGNSDSAYMCNQDSLFPSYDTPAIMPDVAGPNYFDADNDGINDLIVSNFFTGEDYFNVSFYKNIGSNLNHVFNYQTNRFLVSDMIETGTAANPVFHDVDNDGKKDLIIGNDYYFNANQQKAKLTYYRNTGTTKAVFEKITDDFANLSNYNFRGACPSFADLDADGDAEMLIGIDDGTLLLFTNLGTVSAPLYILTQPNFQGIDVGDHAAPQFIDLDRDGLQDLVIGERNGRINYYRNTGTAALPVFSFQTDTLGGISVLKGNSFSGFSRPLFFDTPTGYEFLSGSQSGYLYHYGNIDGNLGGSFTLLDSMFQDIYEPLRSHPAMADLDSDGKYDLVVGNISGGLGCYTQDATLSLTETSGCCRVYQVFPNPSTGQVSLEAVHSTGTLSFRISDISGRCILKGDLRPGVNKIDISHVQAGLYFLTDSNQNTARIVKLESK